jgi:hypothetical protein
MKVAEAPFIEGDKLILSFKGTEPTHFVAARFAHEGYKDLHVYKRNQHGVYLLIYPIPSGLSALRYRIVADGLWMNDPENPETVAEKARRISFSVVRLEERTPSFFVNPIWEREFFARFEYRDKSGLNVALVGDFNNWDPYSHVMQETEGRAGQYTITVAVGPGIHFYVFVVDGIRLPDPSTFDRSLDGEGQIVSFFVTPES